MLYAEAQLAYLYLNQIRQNPPEYSAEIGLNLDKVKPIHPLKWNDTLARVAEEKAADMATRDYFGHQTPEGIGINRQIHDAGYKIPFYMIKNKSDNCFESCGGGYRDGFSLIRGLIFDEGTPGKGHRKHLLGLDSFWAKCRDIGIGIAFNSQSEYKYYACVIIADHNY